MSKKCALLKPKCKRNVILENQPFEKPECPIKNLCPLVPDPCLLTCLPLCPTPPSSPQKCPLIPEPCSLNCCCPCPPPPSPCPPHPLPCPLPPSPCPPQKCLIPDPCPPSPSPCPLQKCPLIPDPCPLTCLPLCPPTPSSTSQKCPLIPEPCPLICVPCSPPPQKCPLIPEPCSLNCCCPCPPPPSPCPLQKCQIPDPCPPPSPCPPQKCPLIPDPCTLTCLPLCPPSPSSASQKCPLIPEPCPLICVPISPSPRKCPLIPKTCSLTCLPMCPLKLPQIPKCPLDSPKCPLDPPEKPCKKPTEMKDESCLHSQFLNKSLKKRPQRFPSPPPLCEELVRKCPFEPKPIKCHDFCPCVDVPDVNSGPPCPFLPDEPVCPPLCPLEKQPACPLIQKPQCFWKPQTPPKCCLVTSAQCCCPCISQECELNKVDVCPSFICLPGKLPKCSTAKATSNIECCPFCNCVPSKVGVRPYKEKRTFHFPSCPLFKIPSKLVTLPPDEPVCPFYPCPCPLNECDNCPIKVPPLTTLEKKLNSKKSGLFCTSQEISTRNNYDLSSSVSSNPGHQNISPQRVCCPPPESDCNKNLKTGPQLTPPCPLKGCLKKSAAQSPGDCPIKMGSCTLFPQGRCPMEDLGLCDCEYPVPPCMLDIKTVSNEPAKPQYCLKSDCCMGLPDPPVVKDPYKDNTYYSFVPLHPGSESSKYYVDIRDEPPDGLTSGFQPKQPLRPQCSVIKFGEGYKKCKSVRNIIERRGSCFDTGIQYNKKDCLPMDGATKRVIASNANNQSQLNRPSG